MEYDKHIKRLVLGYLKNECKSSYKTFLRTHFHNQHKHVATRVAGQTLEDILQAYSRIHDIVQGHLEDTNYFKDRRNEISPIYLVDQLLYLLEYDRPLTPTSTIRDRSSVPPSLANTAHEEEEEHRSDVETTPEHSLPGNLHSSDENHHFRTPFSNPSPVFRTPYLEKLPTSEHHTISTVMSKELLKNKNFPKKLAQSINMVLNTPERSTCRNDTSKSHGLDKTVIKDVLHRTEADPMFEDLLNDFFGSIGSTIEKAFVPEVAMSSSSTTTESPSPFKQVPATNEHDPDPIYSASTENPNNLMIHSNQNSCISTQQKSSSESSSALQPLTDTPNQLESITSVPFTAASSTQTDLVQQQFYIVNQPVVIPQPMQIMPVPVSNSIIKDISQKVKNGVGTLTEQEIMAMPTIFLNEQNEITYAETQCDSNKQKEVQNLKEYINVFGLGDQSPIIKQPRKKSTKNIQIRPTPSIKVEIFQRNSPLKVPTPLPDLSNSSCNDKNNKNNSSNKNEKRSNSPSTDSSTKSFADENRPNILNAICTPSPIVPTIKKPTPKSSSHVRSLTFPSPIRRTNEKSEENRNSPSGANKQQATKDLFNDKNDNEKGQENNEHEKIKRSSPRKVKSSKKTVVKKCSPLKEGKKLSWDADLRMLAASSPCGSVQDTPSRKTSLKSINKRSVECKTLETEAKTFKRALKTPRKTPTRSKIVKSNKQQSGNQKLEQKKEQATEQLAAESKKVLLSPSKMCNNASKRNMDVDSITPNNPKEGSNQLISNARKNINALLDTPLKEVEHLNEKPSVGTSTTPFTPMLKANLQGLSMTDNFTIETPDFPVTPGLSIMETSITNYCILNDTETNKVTEAIVLSEERKSSVRKTDDEEVEVSPKVYSCKVVLEEFNRNQVGKKNLELLDSKGVHWEGSSEKEEKSESTSSSESNEECNNTVVGITSADIRSNMVKRGGKSMKVLKSQLLDSEKDTSMYFEESFAEAGKKFQEPLLKIEPDVGNPNASMKTRTFCPSKLNTIEKPSIGTDSEIVSKTTCKERIYDDMEALCKAIEDVCGETERSSSEITKTGSMEDQKLQEGLRLKNVLSIALEKCSNFLDNDSLKYELEEKRNLVLKLEKAVSGKSAGRRKSTTPQSTSKSRTSKQKGTPPKKLVRSKEVLTDEKKRDSQDEFFQKSGTNLHRTNRQRRASEENKSLNGFEDQTGETVTKNQMQKEEENFFWYGLQMELQSEEITVLYNSENTPNKASKDYLDVDLKDKGFRFEVPLTNGSIEPVVVSVTPYRTLWEILPTNDSKEDNCSDSDSVRTDDQRCLRKRKHRSDSSNSNSSTKKKKPLLGTYLNNKNIEVVLSMLHGPSDKT